MNRDPAAILALALLLVIAIPVSSSAEWGQNWGQMNWGETATNLPETPEGHFALHPNTPNPFNPSTRIGFDLPFASFVNLSIYDISGRRVDVLANEVKQAGHHELVWLGMNDRGERVSSGVYFYQLKTDSFEQIRRMTLVK